MAFGLEKLRKQLPKKNKITLTCITDGYSYSFTYNPVNGVSPRLRRTLDEFDDQGFPLFFADKHIEGVPVRVRSPEIEARMEYYKGLRQQRAEAARMVDQSRTPEATRVAKEAEKIKDKKAARQVKPKKPKTVVEAAEA